MNRGRIKIEKLSFNLRGKRKKKEKKITEEQSCDWGGLPNHLLDCVLEKLDSGKDVLQFDIVCENWHSTVKDCAPKGLVADTPMLLLGDEEEGEEYWAFDMAAGCFLSSKLVVTYEHRFCGSSRGWLAAVNEDWSVTLHNPFSSSSPTVSLPPVYPPSPEDLSFPGNSLRSFHPYHVKKLLITADPVENPNECVVVAALHSMNGLAIHRLGSGTWGIVHFPYFHHTQNLMLRGSRVYAAISNGAISSIDLDHGPEQDYVVVRPPDDPIDVRDSNSYLVQSCDGETTYLIKRFFKKTESWVDPRKTTKVLVFALDLSTGKYKRVKSIGDNALFLGDNYSICVKAPASSAYLPECIYFTHDVDLKSSSRAGFSDMCIYDLRTRKFKARYVIPRVDFPPIFVLPIIVF